MQWPFPDDDHSWEPLSKPALMGWLAFYAIAMYLYIPYFPGSYFPFMDAAHMVTHESGHMLFGYLGVEFITVAMGAGFQLLVPLMLAAAFARKGQIPGTTFCLWAFFNSMIGVSTYMKDARAKAIPLISPGVASDEVTGHDFEYLFTRLGVIHHDQQIGGFVLLLAWAGMFAMVGWLCYMSLRKNQPVRIV
jgi:hypothetical protein